MCTQAHTLLSIASFHPIMPLAVAACPALSNILKNSLLALLLSSHLSLFELLLGFAIWRLRAVSVQHEDPRNSDSGGTDLHPTRLQPSPAVRSWQRDSASDLHVLSADTKNHLHGCWEEHLRRWVLTCLIHCDRVPQGLLPGKPEALASPFSWHPALLSRLRASAV